MYKYQVITLKTMLKGLKAKLRSVRAEPPVLSDFLIYCSSKNNALLNVYQIKFCLKAFEICLFYVSKKCLLPQKKWWGLGPSAIYTAFSVGYTNPIRYTRKGF